MKRSIPILSVPNGAEYEGSISIIGGARSTLLMALSTVGFCIIIGVPIGLVAGYYRNWICDALMRL
ncbi:ABC transporter permease, partial [Rhizobium leguminosarum]